MNSLNSQPNNGTLNKAVIAALILSISGAGCQEISDGISKELEEIDDAHTLEEERNTLLEVKTNIEKDIAELKKYSGLSPLDFGRNAGTVNKILKSIIEQLKKAKEVVDIIAKTNIHFNPNMPELDDLNLTFILAISEIKPYRKKMKALNEKAKLYKSKRLRDRARTEIEKRAGGVNVNGIKAMPGWIDKIKNAIQDLQKATLSLGRNGIEGCSNNSYVNDAIIDESGPGHCDYSRTAVCRALSKSKTKPGLKSLSRIEKAALQRRLVYRKLLGKHGVDGHFGPKSKRALGKYKESSFYPNDVRQCKGARPFKKQPHAPRY